MSHWHCYAWTGSGADWANDNQRREPSSSLPPTAVRAWLNKPRTMLRHIAYTPDEALTWLREQFEPLAERTLYPELQTQRDIEFRYQLVLADLMCGNDVMWGEWVKGPSISTLAVVGTPEHCHVK